VCPISSSALSLWRGAPFAGLSTDWTASVREALTRRRLEAAICWSDAELRLGRGGSVIDELWVLTAEYPLAESLIDMLMRSLQGAGRTAEALGCYATFRRRVVDELGTEPGWQVRHTHESILRGDRTAPTSAVAPVPDADSDAGSSAGSDVGTDGGQGIVPAQLPLDVVTFAGRDQELLRLNEVAPPPRVGWLFSLARRGSARPALPPDGRTPRSITTRTVNSTSISAGTARAGRSGRSRRWAPLYARSVSPPTPYRSTSTSSPRCIAR
jgi:hypothetical protein